MKKDTWLIVFLIIINFSFIYSQEKFNPTKAIVGKWQVLYSTKKLSNIDKKGFISYEFFDNGICRCFFTDRKCKNESIDYLDCNWIIKRNSLSFSEMIWCNGIISKLPDYNKIKWVNDSLFYSVGREGGQKIYVYFIKS